MRSLASFALTEVSPCAVHNWLSCPLGAKAGVGREEFSLTAMNCPGDACARSFHDAGVCWCEILSHLSSSRRYVEAQSAWGLTYDPFAFAHQVTGSRDASGWQPDATGTGYSLGHGGVLLDQRCGQRARDDAVQRRHDIPLPIGRWRSSRPSVSPSSSAGFSTILQQPLEQPASGHAIASGLSR